MKNILREIKLLFAGLFGGLSKADSVIMGQSIDSDDKVIPLQQVKDTQRVAHHLLKGEITQEVKELRYRDYLVSEQSRNYAVNGDEATKTSKIQYISNYFGGVNHELYLGINDLDGNDEYTLKFEYEDVPRFNLSRHCTQFYVDLTNSSISLYFSLLPNRDIATNKAFLNYIEKTITSFKMGGEFATLNKIWFISYKISSLQNYLKFTFNDLQLTEIDHTDKNLIMRYHFKDFSYDDLIKEYRVDELDEKYKNKTPKKLPATDLDHEIYQKCEVCGKVISKAEGFMSKEICGKECCSDCIFIVTAENPDLVNNFIPNKN